MGLFDKVKGLAKGHKKEIDQGIDKAADLAQAKAPDQLDGAIDKAADAAKQATEKLDG